MLKEKFEPRHVADIDKITVSGKPLEELYGGYLGNPEIASLVAETIKEPQIEDRLNKLRESGEPIRILELGAGTGIVGKAFAEHLYEQGYDDITLTMSDRNVEAFENTSSSEMSPYPINKIVLDNKSLQFKPNSTDFIVGRSFSHYEKNDVDEKRVFQQAFDTLKVGGFFINQVSHFPTETEATLWRKIQKIVGKEVNLRTLEHDEKLLKDVFGDNNVVPAKEQPPLIHQTKQDFIRRFKLDEQSDIIQQIEDAIKEVPTTERASFGLTYDDFFWDVTSTILICEKSDE
jgi:SAM-dependent methyltransferase